MSLFYSSAGSQFDLFELWLIMDPHRGELLLFFKYIYSRCLSLIRLVSFKLFPQFYSANMFPKGGKRHLKPPKVLLFSTERGSCFFFFLLIFIMTMKRFFILKRCILAKAPDWQCVCSCSGNSWNSHGIFFFFFSKKKEKENQKNKCLC